MAVVAIKELLEAGVHFGHQTRRWNPKMGKFIFEERNGIHIIDLQKTQRLLDYATQYARNIAKEGGKVLFVGTKKQAGDAIREEAEKCGMPYVSERWLGGMLTNMKTIRKSIGRLVEIEDLEKNGILITLPKKEQAKLRRELSKLNKNLGGIRDMNSIPKAIFIIDINKEHIARAESKKLGMVVIALVDSNCNPEKVDFVIPGNDDAMSSIKLIAGSISKAVAEGVEFYKQEEEIRKKRVAEERKKNKEKKSTAKKASVKSKNLQKELAARAVASAEPETAKKAESADVAKEVKETVEPKKEKKAAKKTEKAAEPKKTEKVEAEEKKAADTKE